MKSEKAMSAAESPIAGPLSAVTRILGCVWKALVMSRLFATNVRRVSRRTSTPWLRGAVTSAPLQQCIWGQSATTKAGGEEAKNAPLRREVSAIAGQDGNVNVFASGDLAHETGQAVVEVRREGVEFLLVVQGYDGEFTARGKGDLLIHGGLLRKECLVQKKMIHRCESPGSITLMNMYNDYLRGTQILEPRLI